MESKTRLFKNLRIAGTQYLRQYQFDCGNDVPVYEAYNIHGLNQIIGHAKFNNRSYGDVLYRGECKLHPTMIPSLFRNRKRAGKAISELNKVINKITQDDKFQNELKLDSVNTIRFVDNKQKKNDNIYKIEGMLQHYGVPTRFLDVVDNHWVSLWMGLNKCECHKTISEYYHYNQRSISLIDYCDNPDSDQLYQYIILFALPHAMNNQNNGIWTSNDFVQVDLRQALPSVFLRPHAQHGLVIRKLTKDDTTSSYDMASEVIGIICVRIDRSASWIGNGELLTQENLFPSPGSDVGYDILLSRTDFFDETRFNIARYI